MSRGKTTKQQNFYFRIGQSVAKARLLYMQGLYSVHLKQRYLHDVTYNKGGWYKRWTDKPYSSSVHKASLIAFVVSFVAFSVFQSIFFWEPNQALAGSITKKWTTKSDFDSATIYSQRTVSGDNDANDANNNDFVTIDQSAGLVNLDLGTGGDGSLVVNSGSASIVSIYEDDIVTGVTTTRGVDKGLNKGVGSYNSNTGAVPNFVNVTINAGATLTTSSPVTSTPGARLEMKLTGKLTIQSTAQIDVTGKGYNGGPAEITAGYGPGGGAYGGDGAGNGGTFGGAGGLGNASSRVGGSRVPYNYTTDPFGSGGGPGGNGFVCNGPSGSAGGGAIKIQTNSIDIQGTIRANGVSSSPVACAAGGGGAGGSILLYYNTAINLTGNLSANGGNGNAWSGTSKTASGGGGGGWIFIQGPGVIPGTVLGGSKGIDPDNIATDGGANPVGAQQLSPYKSPATLGAPTAGAVGLRADAGADKKAKAATLTWTGTTASAGQKLLFKVRAGDTQAELDTNQCYGPTTLDSGCADWSTAGKFFSQVYNAADPPNPTISATTIPSAIAAKRYIEVLVRMESDGSNTPVLNDVTLTYDTLEAPVNTNTNIKKTDGSFLKDSTGNTITAGTAGGWTNETSAKVITTGLSCDGCGTFTNPYIEVETKPVGSAFDGTTGITVGNVDGSNQSTATLTNLTPGTGYHLQMRTKDAQGRVSAWTPYGTTPDNVNEIDFKIDQTSPTGTVTIKNGDNYTSSTSVPLTISASDTGGSELSQMRLSNDGSTWSDWETYSTTKYNGVDPNPSWDLTIYGGNSNDGEKTVYIQYRDNAGNVSGTWVQTSQADFDAGTKSNILTQSVGTFTLLKPLGAAATSGSECMSGYVSGGVCANPWLPGRAGTAMAGKGVYYRNIDATDGPYNLATLQWKTSQTYCVGPQCATGLDPNYTSNYALVSPQTNPTVDFASYPAQNACKTIGGRLPYMNELIELYNGRASYGNNFGTGYVWSATEYAWDTARIVDFSSGGPLNNLKTYTLGGRGVARCVSDEGGNSLVLPGNLISSTKDSTTSQNYGTISWSADVPTQTGADALRFQVASNNDNATWNFVGPDGTAGTYYTSSGTQLWSGHNGSRYIKYKAYLQTASASFTPTVYDVSIGINTGISDSITLDTTKPSNDTGTITRPLGGESFVGANHEELTWDSTKITDATAGLSATPISIKFSQNNGTSWSSVATGEANDGSYDWTVPNISCLETCRVAILATDNATNTGTTSDPNTVSGAFSIVSDSTAPVWDPDTTLDVSNTKYTSGATTWTDATPTLSWSPAPTDPAPGSGIASYEVIFEGDTHATITGINTTETSPTLSEGTHTWYVKAIDGAGQDSNTKDDLSLTKTIHVDDTAPTADILISSGTGIGYSATNVPNITLNLTNLTEAGSGFAGVKFSNDGILWTDYSTTTTNVAWNLETSPGGTSTKGTRTIYYKLIDNVGNTTDSLSGTIIYDTTRPNNPTSVSASLVSNQASTYADGTWTGNSSVSIAWSGETDSAPASGIKDFAIYRSIDDAGYTAIGTDTASPYVDTALVDGHNYKYLVEVVDNAGNRSTYLVGETAGDITLADITSPSTPISFNAIGTDSTTVAITWQTAPENSTSHSGKAHSYLLQRTAALGATEPATENGSCSTNTYSTTIGTYSFEQSGIYDSGTDKYTATDSVTAEQWYYYRARAYDEGSRSSSYVCYKARGNFAPVFNQEDISLSVNNDHTTDTVVPGDILTLDFRVTDADGREDLDTGNATQRVRIQNGSQTEVLPYTAVTTKEDYSANSLDGYHYTYQYTLPTNATYGTYTISINVADSVAVGNPGDNNHNQVKQLQFKTPPATPATLSATGYTSTSINLSWTAPTNGGLRNTNTYSIKRRAYGSEDSFTHIAYSTTTSYRNTGLTLGSAYEYQVTAYDVSGNEGPVSNSSNAVPPAPATPSSATVKDASATSIDLGGTYPVRYLVSWDEVTSSTTPDFKGYKLYRETNGIWEGSPIAEIDCNSLGYNQTYYLDLHSSNDEINIYRYKVQTWDESDNEGDPATTLATNTSVTPQIVAQPTATETGVSYVKLTWKSNQSTAGLVQYKKASEGEYTNYAGDPRATTTQSDSDYVHTITVRGLEKGTSYKFKVKSINSSNVMSAASNEITASTKAFTISDVSKDIKASSAIISWSTNEVPSNAIVIYNKVGDDAESATSDNPPKETLKTNHSVELKDLVPGDYSFYVKSYDDEGNLAEAGNSNLYTFTITGFDAGAISSPKAGKIEEQDITATSAKITWTSTIATTSWVDYGTSSGKYDKSTGNDTLTIDHIITLDGLTPGQTYYYIVRGLDANGTEYKSQEYSFVALAKPSISSVEVLDVTSYTATIRVQVTKEVEASLSYGIGQINEKAGGESLATVHTITLENLTDGSTYDFYVDVKDTSGNTARSKAQTFTTPIDREGPKVSDLKIDILPMGESDETAQVVISWTTNKPATTKVEYDEGVIGGKYSKSTIEDTSLNTAHTVIIKELNPSTTYHFRIAGVDKRNNKTNSQDYTFVTPEKNKSIWQLIVRSLEETFSWVSNVGGFFRNLGSKFGG